MNSYERAEKAITDLFGDTTQKPTKTRDDLQGLRDHIDTLLEALAADGVE